MMEFTDLLDEYLELKADYDEHKLSEWGIARLNEVAHEISARIRDDLNRYCLRMPKCGDQHTKA